MVGVDCGLIYGRLEFIADKFGMEQALRPKEEAICIFEKVPVLKIDKKQ